MIYTPKEVLTTQFLPFMLIPPFFVTDRIWTPKVHILTKSLSLLDPGNFGGNSYPEGVETHSLAVNQDGELMHDSSWKPVLQLLKG